MSKILFIGDLRSHTRSSQRYRALREVGHYVNGLSFAALSTPADGGHRTLLQRVRHRLGLHPDTESINESIISLAGKLSPDVLWVEKALCLRPSTLRTVRARQPATRLVFNSDDDMFVRHNQSVWFRRCLELYDLVVTNKSHNASAQELPAMGARRVVFIPKTFDPHTHRPIPVTASDKRRLGGDVGFIGTFERERAESLLELARRGICVRVWGHGWEAWKRRHANLQVEGRGVLGEDYVRSICATRINLGFLRRKNRDLHSDRSVEVPASGGFLLGERTSEHLQLFHEGVEAAFFGGIDELADKIHYYLAHEDERRAVASAGRRRCLADDYSHHSALRRMMLLAEEPAA